MAKKTIEDLIIELKEMFLEREMKYLQRMLNEEEVFADELKFLKQLKARINYVEKLHQQLTGKTGKEKSQGEQDIWAKIIDMQSSVGKIVRQIPKTGTDNEV